MPPYRNGCAVAEPFFFLFCWISALFFYIRIKTFLKKLPAVGLDCLRQMRFCCLGATERKLFSILHPVARKNFNAFALTVKTATHFFKKLFLLHISSRFSPRGTEENCFCPFGTISVWVSYAILGCGEFTAKRFVRHLCVQNLCLQILIQGGTTH